MKTVQATQFRKDFSNWITEAAALDERVLIIRQGEPVAALIPLKDLEALDKIDPDYQKRKAEQKIQEIKNRKY